MNEATGLPRRDGFTLVEILVVIVILGVLATAVVFAVGGVTERGEENSCEADRRVVEEASRFYMLEHSVAAVPPTGAADADRYERTLVDAGFLAGVSTYHDVQAGGTVVTTGAPCP